MKKLFAVLFLCTCLISSGQTSDNIQIRKLSEGFYLLTSNSPYPSNFLAFASEEGILLVDSGQKETGPELKKVLNEISVGNNQLKILINTHVHIDHTGGNLFLHDQPIVIGSSTLKQRMRSGPYVLYEFPDRSLPNISCADSMEVFFGGERIRIICLPGAHDNTDLIVHFTRSNIVCMGDIIFGMTFPSVDGFTGNILKYPEVIGRAISLIPENSIIVTGHGEALSVEQAKQFRNTLIQTIGIVQNELSKGRNTAELKQDDLLKDWTGYDGILMNRSGMISMIANAGKNTITGSTIEELYKALEKHDAAYAVERYYELKKNYPDKYFFGENPLIQVGYWLLKKQRVNDAIEIFKLYVKEFPESWNSYDSLGEAYAAAGENSLSEENYRKAEDLKKKQ